MPCWCTFSAPMHCVYLLCMFLMVSWNECCLRKTLHPCRRAMFFKPSLKGFQLFGWAFQPRQCKNLETIYKLTEQSGKFAKHIHSASFNGLSWIMNRSYLMECTLWLYSLIYYCPSWTVFLYPSADNDEALLIFEYSISYNWLSGTLRFLLHSFQ